MGPNEVVLEGASQAVNQRGPCPGRKLGCEPLREVGFQRTLKTIIQGRKQASLNGCSSQSKATPEDMVARQGKPLFSHPHSTLAMEELKWWTTKEHKESLGARKAHRTPLGSSSVKCGLQSHLPVGLGLKEIIPESAWHRVGPMEVLINVPLAARPRGPRCPGGKEDSRLKLDHWIPDLGCEMISTGARGMFAGEEWGPWRRLVRADRQSQELSS